MTSIEQEVSKPRKREVYLDNLKTGLTSLVIYHHAALCYGGVGANVYQDPRYPQLSSVGLSTFVVVNQTFFMGTFFYLSGQNTRKTASRKTRQQFAKDKLYRLGLPTVAYALIAPPIYNAILLWHKGEPVGPQVIIDSWKRLRGAGGPTWYTAQLLAFDLLYIALQKPRNAQIKAKSTSSDDSTGDDQGLPSTLNTVLALAVTSASTFLLRAYPNLPPPFSSLVTFFKINTGYFPGYVLAYILGLRTATPLSSIPRPATVRILLPSVAAVAAMVVRLLSSDKYQAVDALQGANPLALSYALMNDTMGYLLGSAVLLAAKKYADKEIFGPWIIGNAFGAFLTHMHVLVAVGVAAEKWDAGPIMKTAVVGTATVVLSWLAGSAGGKVWGWMKGIGKWVIGRGREESREEAQEVKKG